MSRRQVRQAETMSNPAPGSRSCRAVTLVPAAGAREDESIEETWWSEVTADVTVTSRRESGVRRRDVADAVTRTASLPRPAGDGTGVLWRGDG